MNTLAVIIIIVAFFIIIALMIRKSMNSGDELRKELYNTSNAIPRETERHDDGLCRDDQSSEKEINTAPLELLDSTESLKEFLEKENLVKASIFQQVKIYDRLAREMIDGKRNIKIDPDNVPSHTHPGKLEASVLFIGLERRLKEMQNLTPFSSYTYRFVAITAFVIQVIAILVYLLVDAL